MEAGARAAFYGKSNFGGAQTIQRSNVASSRITQEQDARVQELSSQKTVCAGAFVD